MSKILLVDDDVQVNEVVKTTLELMGHIVVAVDSCTEAEQVYADLKPDIALIDYILPGGSGLDLLERMNSEKTSAVRFLATGLADFQLLKQALKSGAASILSKPYRLTDLAELVELAALLDESVRLESEPESDAEDTLRLVCPSGKKVRAEDLAQLIRFARAHGADQDVAARELPLMAGELMKNAGTHGMTPESKQAYSVELKDEGESLRLTVSAPGKGFDWRKMLARAQTSMDKSRASGLQIVLAMADELKYQENGCVAKARISKHKIEANRDAV